MLIKKFKKIAKKDFGFLLQHGFNERQDAFGALVQNLGFEKMDERIQNIYGAIVSFIF